MRRGNCEPNICLAIMFRDFKVAYDLELSGWLKIGSILRVELKMIKMINMILR
jgi:hypothetical protein